MASRGVPHSMLLGLAISWKTTFLKLKSCLHGLKRSPPLHAARLGNILEDNFSSALDLVFHQLHTMLALLIGALTKELGKAMKSLVISVEVGRHGEIDIAGIELHVDLLVDQGLALLVVVLSDLVSHVGDVCGYVLLVASTLSGAASYQQGG